jgi:phytoene desaturase
VPFLDFASMIKAAPALARYQAWRSVYSIVSKFIESEKLREAFSFHTLLVGGNPMNTSAIYALIHKLEKDGGVWWARGGTNRLIAGMVRQFQRIGGEVRMGDPVVRIETLGNRVTGVHTASGWHGNFDAVASNGDIMHTYRDLLGDSATGKKRARAQAQEVLAQPVRRPFRHRGHLAGHPHHMILFGPRYKGLLDDIYQHGVLPQDFSIYLHHPTVTDPSVAPRDEHVLRAGAGGQHGQAAGGLGGSRPGAGKAHPR